MVLTVSNMEATFSSIRASLLSNPPTSRVGGRHSYVGCWEVAGVVGDPSASSALVVSRTHSIKRSSFAVASSSLMMKGNYKVSFVTDCRKGVFFVFFGRAKYEAGVEGETSAIGVSPSSFALRLPSLAWTKGKTCSAGLFCKDLVEIYAPM